MNVEDFVFDLDAIPITYGDYPKRIVLRKINLTGEVVDKRAYVLEELGNEQSMEGRREARR